MLDTEIKSSQSGGRNLRSCLHRKKSVRLSIDVKHLQRALALANGHISLYTLTLEPGTQFYRRAFEPSSIEEACIRSENVVIDMTNLNFDCFLL